MHIIYYYYIALVYTHWGLKAIAFDRSLHVYMEILSLYENSKIQIGNVYRSKIIIVYLYNIGTDFGIQV